jgi:hypothetical protein
LLFFGSPQQAFRDLRDFTQSRFFSADTVLDPILPGPSLLLPPRREDPNYFYGACIAGSPCPDGRRKLAYKGLRYVLSGPNDALRDPRKATINEEIAEEEWAVLAPQAVLYVASFIQHYINTVTPGVCFHNFTLNKLGSGRGAVTSGPAGINCGVDCLGLTKEFSIPILTLIADAAPGSRFTAWGGDCAGMTATTTLALDRGKTCTAAFELGGTLAILKSGTGTGTVVSTPVGINCGPSCPSQSARFTGNVQLTATPAFGSSFGGWSGACSGTATLTTINVTSDKTCTATFRSGIPAVRLNPFGLKGLSEGPFTIQVVNSSLSLISAPRDITVTLLREVRSPCRGVIFSSPRTFVIPEGQSSSGGPDAAGRDPLCSTSPTRTEWTIINATMDSGTPLDLTVVPSQQLFLSISR